MSGAARRNDTIEMFDFPGTGSESTSPLKEAVTERLAAHRSRVARTQAEQAIETAQEAAAGHRARMEARHGAARVRDAVAKRYQESLSYREFLAAEAERAIEQAQAEADMAARKVKAVAEAQLQLLEEMEQWSQPQPGPREVALAHEKEEARRELAHELADIALGARELIQEPVSGSFDFSLREQAPQYSARSPKSGSEISAGGLTVRLYEEIGTSRAKAADLRLGRNDKLEAGEFELDQLEEEIEFRRAPEFEPHVIETTPIPGNLIEFPRQLIAARKARPRLAEGPMREDLPPEPQLRIFEVEAEQISIEPDIAEPAAVPEWQTLVLESRSRYVPTAPVEAQAHFTMQPQTAPLELRLMSAAVDGCCLLLAFTAFATVVVEISGPAVRALSLPMLGASSAGVLLVMFVMYQLLFFSLAEATPGMRYARIALCTFNDDNPSRKAMRRRVYATLLAACPLAIGLAWAFMDDERLGWHDRMSKMYQRAY